MSTNENLNPVFFYSAKSDVEAEIIISKLKASGIEAFLKRDDLGAVSKLYTGQSTTGADIYVPYAALTDANNILSINEADIPPFNGEETSKPQFSKGFIKKIVVLGALIIILTVAIYIATRLS
ncbi:MAG: hypothetical protein IJE46_04880 [Clostridia bacterium]|nr:hypothetical protein [Clostridia bacterium]